MCNFCAQEQNHDRGTDEKEENQLRRIGCFCFSLVLQKALDHIRLNLHAVHLRALVNGCKISILQSRRVGPDQNDLACPVICRHLAAEDSGDRYVVIIPSGAGCIGNIEMPSRAHLRQFQFLSLLRQISPGCLAGHGIDPAVGGSVRIHIQKAVAHHAVHIRHGIDMPLGRAVPQ